MLRELFERNNKIVINTDIDGFLSGMILQEYFGCEIVGFSNSKSKVWLKEGFDELYAPIYIDLYVNNPETVCIEQHILAYDMNHLNEINRANRMGAYITKLNPNLERSRNTYRNDYAHKYPFGTVHYLISLMEREGICVHLPALDVHQPIDFGAFVGRYDICPGQILLRADDALYTTIVKYPDNARDWWDWLNPYSDYQSINQMCEYLNELDEETATRLKQVTGNFFRSGLGCDGIDGSFDSIVLPDGSIKRAVLDYIQCISNIMDMNLTIPLNFVTHQGIWQKNWLRRVEDITMRQDVFSYAIIASPNAEYKQLSFTLDMN